MTTPGSPYDHDPAALEWARGRVHAVTAQWRARAENFAGEGMLENAEKWRRIAQITENALIGTPGVAGEFGAFDERRAFTADPPP